MLHICRTSYTGWVLAQLWMDGHCYCICHKISRMSPFACSSYMTNGLCHILVRNLSPFSLRAPNWTRAKKGRWLFWISDHISSLLSAIYFWSIWTIFETRQTVSNFLLRLIILIGWIEDPPNWRLQVISAQTFHHRNISACGHFVSMVISARRLFSTWTFPHKDFLA